MKNTPYLGNIEVSLFIPYTQTENNKCLKFDEQFLFQVTISTTQDKH